MLPTGKARREQEIAGLKEALVRGHLLALSQSLLLSRSPLLVLLGPRRSLRCCRLFRLSCSLRVSAVQSTSSYLTKGLTKYVRLANLGSSAAPKPVERAASSP